MGKKGYSENKKIWTYAVILFTGAFTVLLITAFSQIRLNKNIQDYKNQLSSEEKKKANFQINLNSALEENKELLKKVEDMQKVITKDNKSISDYKKAVSSVDDRIAKEKHVYEILIEAEEAYKKDDLKGCALLLHNQCTPGLLDSKGFSLYEFLVKNTYYEVAQKSYFDGYKSYKKNDFNKAIENFQNAAALEPTEYFADDCYYFIAYSKYKMGDKNGVIQAAKDLTTKYPNSTYIEDINDLLTKL